MDDQTKDTLRDFFRGIFLVFIQLFILPWRIILVSISSLAEWGKAKQLPSARSDFPVLTFVVIDLKPFVIILTCLGAVLGAIPTFGVSLLVGYLSIPLIAYSFEIVSLFISAVNSLKRIEKR